MIKKISKNILIFKLRKKQKIKIYEIQIKQNIVQAVIKKEYLTTIKKQVSSLSKNYNFNQVNYRSKIESCCL